MNFTLVVRLGHVQSAEPFVTTKVIQNILDPRDGLTVWNGFSVQPAEIYTESQPPVLLSHTNHGAGIW